ncbi:hypothetical protein O9993_04400 [Vibrio lentus]|nr:hypothetical protein [Vibrio lentus]
MVSKKNTTTQKHCELCYLIGYKNTHHGWSHLNVTCVNWINPNDAHPRWCNDCLNLFEPMPHCQRCGLKTLTTVEQCGQCLSKPLPWHRLYCVGDYTFQPRAIFSR